MQRNRLPAPLSWALALTPEHLGFDEYDVATQRMWSHHYRLGGGSAQVTSVPFRYVWPGELDLMAQIAGLERRHRWADLDDGPVHQRQHRARLGVAEALSEPSGLTGS